MLEKIYFSCFHTYAWVLLRPFEIGPTSHHTEGHGWEQGEIIAGESYTNQVISMITVDILLWQAQIKKPKTIPRTQHKTKRTN